MYDGIQKLQPDFAIFTGDIVDHAIWDTTVSQNTFEISSAYQHMVDAGMKLVYGTVGNHEQHPTNAIPPSHLDTSSVQWLYDLVASIWTKWIGSVAEVKFFGAYSVKHKESNLRIISISTNMYYTLNFWLYQDIRKDPSDQFSWLVGELDAAEKAGERVYIVGHMPMGYPDALYDGSNYFDQIVNRYKDTIAAMFFGEILPSNRTSI
jgi:sphingomyelin phosphodiesterase